MESWASRQRDTNNLARSMGTFLFANREPTADQLYGLSKLSWITDNCEVPDAPYISSTKIPAFGDMLSVKYRRSESLASVAKNATEATGDRLLAKLVMKHTGFTNFYKPYRNSVRPWMRRNHSKLLPIYRAALRSKSDRDRLAIVEAIAALPGIPKANHAGQQMRPEFFLTPVFFMLDPKVRFPIINGNSGVKALLAKLGVTGRGLADQYKALVSLYGRHGVRDAADLDQLGHELPEFIDSPGKKARKGLLRQRTDNERDLQLKDEDDCAAIRKAMDIRQRRIHNALTNALYKTVAQRWTVLEGVNDCRFDALVKKFNGVDDLLIEAKSSVESAHLRMAVGQLHHYWHQLYGTKKPHLAILLPTRPEKDALDFLDWMRVGTIWLEGTKLATCTPALAKLTGAPAAR